MDYFTKKISLFSFRRMFYLVTPDETTFPSLKTTPNFVDDATSWFVVFIALEIVYNHFFAKKRGLYSVNDAVTSVSAGLLQITMKTVFRYAEFRLACYIYENYCLITLPWDSPCCWILSFLLVDFSYYWFHRAAHEVNILWAFHQMHHSSEYYNFSTALRQGMFQQYASTFFYLPEAFIIPPQLHMVHLSLNLLFQFWLHTQMIPRLGFLELIINTPSLHRVHHGRNAYCIDKNYGGALIVWDRLFGTFHAEKTDEVVAYGLVHNVHTFDQLYCQLFYFKYLIFEKAASFADLRDKMKTVFYGPGWYPGTPRTGDLKDIPEIEKPINVYDRKTCVFIQIYIIIQVYLCFPVYEELVYRRENMALLETAPYVFFILYSTFCFGCFFEQLNYASLAEATRYAYFYWMYKFKYVYFPRLDHIRFDLIIFTVIIFWILYYYRQTKRKKE